jgi:hypothetical protein
VNGSCEPSGSLKYLEVLEWLSDWRLFKKGSDPCSWLVGSLG